MQPCCIRAVNRTVTTSEYETVPSSVSASGPALDPPATVLSQLLQCVRCLSGGRVPSGTAAAVGGLFNTASV